MNCVLCLDNGHFITENKREIIIITPIQQHSVRYLGKIHGEYQIEVDGRIIYVPKEDTVFMVGFDYSLVLDGILFHVSLFINDFDIVINGMSAMFKVRNRGMRGTSATYAIDLKTYLKTFIRLCILLSLMLYVYYLNLGYAKTLFALGFLYMLFLIVMFIYGSAQDKAKHENDI